MYGAQIGSCINNYNLHTYTPNGNRETHAIAIAFTQQSLDEDEDYTCDSIIIPRVSITEMKTTKLSKLAGVEFHYSNAPKKPTLPYTEVHQGISFQDIVKINKDI